MSGRRGSLILGTVLAAAALVGVLIALSARSGDGSDGAGLSGVAQVLAELEGIPQRGATLGRADAPIEISEYADMQCPFCARAGESVVPGIIAKYVRPGRAKLVFRPLAFIGEDSVRGARAVVAAGRQNRLWQVAGVLFRSQGAENAGWLTDDLVRSATEAVGGDADRLEREAGDAETAAAVAAAATAAEAASVESTPTFVIRGPGGVQYVRGAADTAAFDTAIAAASG